MIGALCAVLALRAPSLEVSMVATEQMAPTLRPGQRVLIEDWSQDPGPRDTPRRGDVLVLRVPGISSSTAFKRLIGRPGDVVVVSDGREIAVPDDCYFMLGDNRLSSFGTHEGWFVPTSEVVGRVVLSYWPPASLGGIAHPPTTERLSR
jgi:signal peptidase I